MGFLSEIFQPKSAELIYSEPTQKQELEQVMDQMKAAELTYSSPFITIKGGNLSLPYINNSHVGVNGMVLFGESNRFPQLINQMYYTSPLHGSIIDFKMNSISGGGYELVLKNEDLTTRAAAIKFEVKNKIKKLYKPITRDLVQHYRAYFRLEFNGKVFSKATRIAPEKVRKNKDGTIYFICDDWTQNTKVETLNPFKGRINTRFYILPIEIECVGQDTYPVPVHSSMFNWCQLDGQMSLLHKSNIDNSIFPSFALLFPKKPNGDVEKKAIKDTIDGAKGAPNAGRIFALFANNAEQLPKIEPIPANQNDRLFEQTDERIDAQICKAHTIDPLLMGIRVSGKLGSGTDIEKSYIIYEKNTVIPFREYVEEGFNELLGIARVPAEFKLKNYQIINDAIVEVSTVDTKLIDRITKLSPLVANKLLESLTLNEIRSIGGAGRVNGGDKVAAPAAAPQMSNQQT